MRRTTTSRRTGAVESTPVEGYLDGLLWNQLEKVRWDDLEALDVDNRTERMWMQAVSARGLALLPPRQRQAVELVYRQGLTLAEAAQVLGVDPSTAGRSARRGMEELRRYAAERELTRACTGPDGALDRRRLAEESTLLTSRQRQVMLLSLEGRTATEIGGMLGLDPSAVRRTLARGEERLNRVTPWPTAQQRRQAREEALRRNLADWRKSGKEVAAACGVSLRTVYRRAGARRWEGMTALQYQVWQRYRAGEKPADIAAALSMDVKNVYQLLARARRAGATGEEGEKDG